MSNALNFIESNVEDLDKEQRLHKIRTDLQVAIESQLLTRPSIGNLVEISALSDL